MLSSKVWMQRETNSRKRGGRWEVVIDKIGRIGESQPRDCFTSSSSVMNRLACRFGMQLGTGPSSGVEPMPDGPGVMFSYVPCCAVLS